MGSLNCLSASGHRVHLFDSIDVIYFTLRDVANSGPQLCVRLEICCYVPLGIGLECGALPNPRIRPALDADITGGGGEVGLSCLS